MFQRTRKSPRVAEPSAGAGFGYAAGLRVEHLQAWRDAAKEVRSTYRDWCTAGRRDSHRLYLLFLDALKYEELAAREVERDATALGPRIPPPEMRLAIERHASAVGTTRRARAD